MKIKKINNIYNTASMKLGRFVKDIENSVGKKLLHDSLVMEGIVDIVNGNNIIHGKNSIVDQGLCGVINIFGIVNSSNNSNYPSNSFNGTNGYMVVGSDTSHSTANGTTALQAPIGTSPGTKPNTYSGAASSPGSGQWQVQWICTWNPGTLPAVTLGEVGLYLYLPYPAATLQPFNLGGITFSSQLFSRMASAEGKFSFFTINNTVPLSISWIFRLTWSP